MQDPFEYFEHNLVNVSSGAIPDKEVTSDLESAFQVGSTHFRTFVNENLTSDEPDLFRPIKKNNLKTFATKEKKKSDEKVKQSRISRDLFGRLLLLSHNRDIDLPDLLSKCLTTFPLSIATEEGNMRKTTKSTLLSILEKNTNQPETVKAETVIIDAMAVIQSISKPAEHFGKLACQIFEIILSIGKKFGAKRLDFVGDRYPEECIKNAERKKRYVQPWQTISILNSNQAVPSQWKMYLSVGENKERLLSFLASTWTSYPSEKFEQIVFYVTDGESCVKLSPSSCNQVSSSNATDLSSNHEEADTRMILHCKHAALESTSVVVRTPDTDVITMLTSLHDKVQADVFVETGVGNNRRILDIKILANNVTDYKSLIGFHAFTGMKNTVLLFKNLSAKNYLILFYS